jgi:hypothetical protein
MAAFLEFVHAHAPALDGRIAVLDPGREDETWAAFPTHVAARLDVIDIRRIWRFSEVLKLLEEVG